MNCGIGIVYFWYLAGAGVFVAGFGFAAMCVMVGTSYIRDLRDAL